MKKGKKQHAISFYQNIDDSGIFHGVGVKVTELDPSLETPLVTEFGTFMSLVTSEDEAEFLPKLSYIRTSPTGFLLDFQNLPEPDGKIYVFGSVMYYPKQKQTVIANDQFEVVIPLELLDNRFVIVEF